MSSPNDGDDRALYLLGVQAAAGFGVLFPDEPSQEVVARMGSFSGTLCGEAIDGLVKVLEKLRRPL